MDVKWFVSQSNRFEMNRNALQRTSTSPLQGPHTTAPGHQGTRMLWQHWPSPGGMASKAERWPQSPHQWPGLPEGQVLLQPRKEVPKRPNCKRDTASAGCNPSQCPGVHCIGQLLHITNGASHPRRRPVAWESSWSSLTPAWVGGGG